MGLERTLLSHSSRVSGAAPIRESTKKYFESLGLFISELYGSTETSGPTSTILEKRKFKRICDVIEFSDFVISCYSKPVYMYFVSF